MTICRAVLALSLLATDAAHACNAGRTPVPVESPRRSTLELRHAGTKQIYPSRTMLSIPLPAATLGRWQVAIAQGEPESVRTLSALEVAHILNADLTQRGGGSGLMTEIPPPASALYFGTLYPGRAQIFLTNLALRPPNTYRIELEVTERREAKAAPAAPPRTLHWTLADQATEQAIRYGDLIEITVPGSAQDEWDTSSAETAGVALRRKRSAGAAMVTFIFSASTSGSGVLMLAPKRAGAEAFRFKFSHGAVIMC